MAASCVTLQEFLTATGTEFLTFGVASTGTVAVASVGAPGDTITIGGVPLTAVAGARTPGDDDFSLISGTVLGVAQSIVDAINDASNSFTTLVTAAIQIPGVPIVQLTTVSTGFYSTLPFVTSAAAVYELDPDDGNLSGGADLLTTILDSSCQMLGSCWGVKKSWGNIYLAAHFATVAMGGAGGPVTSRSIDKISESMAVVPFPQTDAAFASTKWGQMYLALRNSLPNLGIAVGRSNLGFIGLTGGGC